MSLFIIVWLGQVMSLIGSGLTTFGLKVWVYQSTGSVTNFALLTVCEALPCLVVSPIAGALVDRWSRRWVMILSDTGSGLCTLGIALLLATDTLHVWHIYLITVIGAVFNAFQSPAYAAATALLVDKEQLNRANAMISFGTSANQLLSPAISSILLLSIGLWGIILIDFVSFSFAITTLLWVRFPELKSLTPEKTEEDLWTEVVNGLNYIAAKPGLLGLLILSGMGNFFSGAVSIMLRFLVLSRFSPTVLGFIEFNCGIGMLASSGLLTIWSGFERRVRAILCAYLVIGVCVVAIGWHTSQLFLTLGMSVYFASFPVLRTCERVIWQRKVVPEFQGRIFSIRLMILGSTASLGSLSAGFLNDYIFEPLMATDTPLSASLEQIIGAGSSSGVNLLFIVMGSLLIMSAFVAYLYSPFRLVEDELPDVGLVEDELPDAGLVEDELLSTL